VPSIFLQETGDMPVYTKEEIKAQIAALAIKISKTEDEQVLVPGGAGAGFHKQRGDLGAMYRERKRLEDKYELLEDREFGGSKNLARFPRPQ
jgi:hypothetical protein